MRKTEKKWQDIQDIYHYKIITNDELLPFMQWQNAKGTPILRSNHDLKLEEYFPIQDKENQIDCAENIAAMKQAFSALYANIPKKQIHVPGFIRVKQKDVIALHYFIQGICNPERLVQSVTKISNSLHGLLNMQIDQLNEKEITEELEFLQDLCYIRWFLWELCRKP